MKLGFSTQLGKNLIEDINFAKKNNFNEICTVLAEMAQFNSELLEVSIKSNASKNSFVLPDEYAEQTTGVEIDGQIFCDFESQELIK